MARHRRPLLERIALRAVPAEWRPAIAHDLDEERPTLRSPLAFSIHAARAGVRLRLARTRDIIMKQHATPRPPRSFAFADFTRDLRLALRSMARRPLFSAGVIATLAIGIGANTAIYSVFNWVLFRPFPGAAAPAELVTVLFQRSSRQGGRYFVAYRDYADLRDGVPAFSSLAASSPAKVDVTPPGATDSERMDAELVSANYFATFGAVPAPGRDFESSEEQLVGVGTPAIISRQLWRDRFNSSPAALGQTLKVGGHPVTIVGVAPAGFQGRSMIAATDLWLPIGAQLLIRPRTQELFTNRQSTMFSDAIGRLRSGATLEEAQAQATTIAETTEGFARRTPRVKNQVGPILYAGVGHDRSVVDRLTAIFKLVMGAVALLLLLACANAANLLLARSLARRRELAVCRAIGASRFRIVRQQLAEGLVLSLAAGAGGLLLAFGLVRLFDGMRLISFLPVVEGVVIDKRVIAFTTLASILTGLLFSIAPAVASSGIDLNASLKDGLTSSRGSRARMRSGLALAQVAISMLLLISAGLFVRTLVNLRGLDVGMKTDGVVSFSVDPSAGYTRDRSQQYLREMLERVRTIAGVRHAAFSWNTPFLPMRMDLSYSRPGSDAKHTAAAIPASRGYFETLGIPMLAGRDFSDEESFVTGRPQWVAIVSEGLARTVWPDGSPVGARIVLDYPKGREVEVIGVVGNVRGSSMIRAPEPYVYVPAGQDFQATWGSLHVRSDLDLAQLASTIRSAAREVDPNVQPYDIEPFNASIDRALTEQRLFARLSSVFAIVSAILAAIGIYGIMACSVGERMREFGIRLALGARAGLLVRSVLTRAAWLTALGLSVGAGAATLATRTLEARLYGVERFDPATIALAGFGLLVVALLAGLQPALRAARADPAASLKAE
jgi:predicted permease